ncbi:MAG: hypothetical protein AAGK78_14905, partial [Planctomycetota bacterium]
DGNYFLELLMETQPLDAPRIVTPTGYEDLMTAGEAEQFDLIVFDDYSPPSLPEAGTFVYSGGLPPLDATGIRQVTDEDDVPLFYESSDVLDWERDHPMFVGLNLNQIWVADGRLLTLPLGAELLMEGVKGPMLVLERTGPRTNLVFSFDLIQSTWPQKKTFPYFAYQMFEYLAAGEDLQVRESVKPGDSVRVPKSIVDRANLGDGETVELRGPIESPEDTRPVTRTERVSETGVATLGPFEQVGVYRTQPTLGQFGNIAVSLLDANESNLLPSATDPGNLSGLEPAPLDDSGTGGGLRLVEWWRWLVAAAAGLLIVEWFVYTRRVAA